MRRYPLVYTRSVLQEQTVYLESENNEYDIIDWFENAGLKSQPPHRYHNSKDDISELLGVQLMKEKLTEEGWKNQTSPQFVSEKQPKLEDAYLYEGQFEDCPTPEGFVDEFDEPIREYLKEKPKKLRKEFLKDQRSNINGLGQKWEQFKNQFVEEIREFAEGLSTDDYLQMDKSDKKLVDDYYKISPYHNPLGLENYK